MAISNYSLVTALSQPYKLLLEVIIDYGSAFVNYGKITETKSSWKKSTFPAEVPLIKLIGAANLQSPVIARIFLPLCQRNTRLGCVLTNAITFTLLTATEGRPRLTSDTSRSTNTEGTRWTNTNVSSESSDDSLITKCIPIRSTSHWNVLNSLISSPNNVTSIGGETGEDLMRGFALEVWLLLPPSNSSVERNPSQIN